MNSPRLHAAVPGPTAVEEAAEEALFMRHPECRLPSDGKGNDGCIGTGNLSIRLNAATPAVGFCWLGLIKDPHARLIIGFEPRADPPHGMPSSGADDSVLLRGVHPPQLGPTAMLARCDIRGFPVAELYRGHRFLYRR